MLNPEIPLKKIRSFIRRQGRLTPGQQLALDTHWDKFCLNPELDYNFSEVFGRTSPLILEIGFGNGESLAKMAAANPEQDYIGIEVHRPGVGHLLMLLEQERLNNVRIYCHDAIEILEQKIPDQSLAGIHLFFPDPWPKKKHHKRRIVSSGFVDLLTRKLVIGGYFHAATDWQHYAEWMLKMLATEPRLKNNSETNGYCDRPNYRPLTKFEQRGLRLGHGVWDLIFKRVLWSQHLNII
ncbi:MAG: tRNA (guanosine(46)-N7)-methyltransferase TrmB [Methylovulum sp.]|uniref:tRNA (guanosine(46)-N7)-methyltransferase TrmB n=1 Tax=Methylovulum sp. TaxID=1916980 RepID=UPI0026393439|nr:tRNA (guanosine(46)-N7)-methyltransferase TrmB [Methylovulum sp.]MDD2722964.1 tRNA (guanosine(46)-N7)-methyltransferase TrmB [Methylovulum sp.]MDD5123277.1 tRNA (guanosine(46)-N7)-methyltransferase TrmB [Methylovulum sp.]